MGEDLTKTTTQQDKFACKDLPPAAAPCSYCRNLAYDTSTVADRLTQHACPKCMIGIGSFQASRASVLNKRNSLIEVSTHDQSSDHFRCPSPKTRSAISGNCQVEMSRCCGLHSRCSDLSPMCADSQLTSTKKRAFVLLESPLTPRCYEPTSSNLELMIASICQSTP